MMRTLFPDPICWFEGMPLLPQHFQTQALHAAGHAALLAGAARPHYWGVLALEQEEAGLAEGLVRITALDAILSDGLPIRHTADDPVLQIDVRQAFTTPEQTVTVYLAVPPLYRGGQLDQRGSRYRQHESVDVPDLAAGADPASVTTWRPRLHLMTDLGNQEYDRLPLMRLRQQGGGVALTEYVVPCPFVAPESLLGQRVMRATVRAREKCVFLAGRLDAARHAGELDDVAQIERQLSALWMRLPEAEAALLSRSVHPLELYFILAGMAGALASLRPERGVPVFAPFDYMELLASFDPLLEWIDAALATIRQGYRVRQFTAEGGGFWIAPPFEAGAAQAELVIGLRMPADAGEHDAAAWLEQTVIASRPHVPTLARQRMRGLARRPLGRDERAAYSAGDDTAMFAIVLDDGWFDRQEPLHIDVRAGARGVAPWAVQLFTPAGEAGEGAAGAQRGGNE
ncbi:type VI secretion system baseplate subunit TssK [Trinickia violacea]|uniref:Type VI secretion system baseplate subunit TssK n=1 Tax=Trinickia violacea TaxID=2571746 RepID=A0A4P8J4A7_9BURK|nr:type VI secretion system baseplate subunit TssK [Trinickia violacea]QCP53539.1 type VI secretion system baseplate subunit TssK [Trinickia violacea]